MPRHSRPAPGLLPALCQSLSILFVLVGGVGGLRAEITIPPAPLSVRQSVKPMVMLVASKEHRLFYEAYNDASDIDGDGTLDIRFKPAITYLGLFNPDYCYTHDGGAGNAGLFTPAATAAGANRTCNGKWSGNWLNYVTTSRIDALRVVLYGGMREVDTEETILRRAYIPQDAHSWAKEYTSETVDGYRISDYTPLVAPTPNRRHFFGNLTPNISTSCLILTDCSGLAPVLAVVKDSSKRVWDWASSEVPVMRDAVDMHGGTRTDYTVRVRACPPGYTAGCKGYAEGTTTSYKPVGLLHEYGENDALLFGLLSGSYDKNLSGGRLRKPVGSFRDEVNPANGRFMANAGIVQTFNSLRIRDFNNRATQSYRGGWLNNAAPAQGKFPDWGNPIGEMVYESLRYFAGRGAASPAFGVSASTSLVPGDSAIDEQVGLPMPSWDDPYSSNSAANAPICSRANLLVISDVNVSYDSDQVPGAATAFSASGITVDLGGFNASVEAASITAGEPGAQGLHFIGQSGAVFDAAPTAKQVQSLGTIRGLAPDEPTKEGSYHAAAAAYFGKRMDLRADKAGRQSVETFVVALASPLPRISVPLPGKRTITLVPFAKSVAGGGISARKGAFQPTNQIVDFYVEKIANSGTSDADSAVNGGRYFAQFRINFEDVEQGADHDMDVVVQYTITHNADNTVTAHVKPLYQGGGTQHRIGYVISGTTADGVYLEVQDESDVTPYFLNTPPGKGPGYCDGTPAAGAAEEVRLKCERLPYLGGADTFNSASRTFTAGTTPAATLLKDPLWYAAKWGGFKDINGNDRPDLAAEWDADGDGLPDTYLPVQNPAKLREALRKTLDNIVARASSASSLASNSTRLSTRSRLYQAVFNTQRWSGDLLAWRVTAQGLSSKPDWNASLELPRWQERRILVRTADGRVLPLSGDSLPGASTEVVDFLRGDRSQERQRGGTLRDRDSPLGDIVNASPLHDPDTDTVYVSANDGMLHALRASDGRELFAVIPQAAADRIPQLASQAYSHTYLLDGHLARVPRSALTQNRSYLYALMGRGGKGLFSLDVSQPERFEAKHFLWEYTSARNSTGKSDPDLGLMLGQPVPTPLNNGKLGVIVGNGYNSTSGKAVLYIFIINTDGSLDAVHKIDAGAAGDNGLAGPALLDTNRDGKADVVYAGDLQGNVWKFDISADDPAAWGLALQKSPLFKARDASDNPQPITAPMMVAVNDRGNDPNIGKPFVFFGTGAYFRQGDPTDMKTQSWYGLIDDGSPIEKGRSALTPRSVQATGEVSGRAVRAFSGAVAGDMAGKRGWYIDFTTPHSGERVVTGSQIVRLAVPALAVSSMYPVNDNPCVPGGRGNLNLVDPFTGGALSAGVMDAQDDGDFTNDTLRGLLIGSIDLGVGIPGEAVFMFLSAGKTGVFIAGSGTEDAQGTLNGTTPKGSTLQGPKGQGRRIVWREIIKD